MIGGKSHRTISQDEGTSMLDSPTRLRQNSITYKTTNTLVITTAYVLAAAALVPMIVWFWSDNITAHARYLDLMGTPFTVLLAFLLIMMAAYFMVFDESSYIPYAVDSKYMKILRSSILTLTTLPTLMFFYPLRERVEETDLIECSSTSCHMRTMIKYNLAFAAVFLMLFSNLADTFHYVMYEKVYYVRSSPWMQYVCFCLLAVLAVYGVADSALFVVVDDRLFTSVLRQYNSSAIFFAGFTAFEWFLLTSVCAAMTWQRLLPEFFQLTNAHLPEPRTRCPDGGVEIHGICAWLIAAVLVAVYLGLFYTNLQSEEERQSATFYRQLLFLCLTTSQIIMWYASTNSRFSQHPGLSYSHITLLAASFFAFLVIGDGMQLTPPGAWQHQAVKAVHIVAQNVLLMDFIPVWSWYRVALAAGAAIDLGNCVNDDLAELLRSFQLHIEEELATGKASIDRPQPSLIIFLMWCTIEMYVTLFVLHLVHFAGGGRSSLVSNEKGIAVRYASVDYDDEEQQWVPEVNDSVERQRGESVEHGVSLGLPINAISASKQQARHLEMMRRPSPPIGSSINAAATKTSTAAATIATGTVGDRPQQQHQQQWSQNKSAMADASTSTQSHPTTLTPFRDQHQDEGTELTSYYQHDSRDRSTS